MLGICLILCFDVYCTIKMQIGDNSKSERQKRKKNNAEFFIKSDLSLATYAIMYKHIDVLNRYLNDNANHSLIFNGM